jgi:excisionase family DNA binding protein
MVANASLVADNATERGLGMPTRSIGSINPGDVDAEVADRAARRINDYLEGHPDEDLIEAIGEVGTEDALVIPRPTAVMFAQILDLLAQGRGVQIFPKEVELSTQQAAAMLNVSRPYLIGLLEAGRIPFRKVGRHRRIRFEDLMDYKRQDDLNRRVAADKLAELTEELDLY